MPTILGGGALTEGYSISNSLRMDQTSDSGLTKTFSSDGNRKKFTIAKWLKVDAAFGYIAGTQTSGQEYFQYGFTDTGTIRVFQGDGSLNVETSRTFGDASAWYHIVLQIDTTQGTNTNRVKFYINGEQETSYSSTTYPSQNLDLFFNKDTHAFGVGNRGDLQGGEIKGYLADYYFVDNATVAPSVFAETDDNGIWVPKDSADVIDNVTFGTNGFFMNFQETGTSANSSGMGADTSGNDNHFAATNITGAVDITTDTPTNSFATLNPLTNSEMTFSEGMTKTVRGGTNGQFATSTFETNKGKWYFESKLLNYSGNSRPTIGLSQSHKTFASALASTSNNRVYYLLETSYYQSNSASAVTVNSSPATNDIYMWAVDLDNLKFYIGKNGTWLHSSDPSAGNNGLTIEAADYYAVATGPNDNGTDTSRNNEWLFNFGNPGYSISSGNADGKGFGNFEYAVPSGFFSYCTKNLAQFG